MLPYKCCSWWVLSETPVPLYMDGLGRCRVLIGKCGGFVVMSPMALKRLRLIFKYPKSPTSNGKHDSTIQCINKEMAV